MGTLSQGLADGLQETRIRMAQAKASSAHREAAEAAHRARMAEKRAAEAMETARAWKSESQNVHAEAEGFKALFQVMYAAHVEPLLGWQKDDVQRNLSLKAKRWIAENCTEEQRARIREVWGSARMEPWNQMACLVGPPKPAPVIDPPAPQKPGAVTEIRLARWVFFTRPGWAFAGVDYETEADALQAQALANELYAVELRKWQETAIRARNAYNVALEKHDAWIKKYGPQL